MAETNLSKIKHIVLVLSGKGGVGKSSVTTQLALSLKHQGYKVGVLDIDLTGPSIPRMLGLEGRQVHQASQGYVCFRSRVVHRLLTVAMTSWVPVYADEQQNLACMSIGFLLSNKNDSVVWRGPKKTGKSFCYLGLYVLSFLKLLVLFSHDQTVPSGRLLGRIGLLVG